jgi:hypothetical protein
VLEDKQDGTKLYPADVDVQLPLTGKNVNKELIYPDAADGFIVPETELSFIGQLESILLNS